LLKYYILIPLIPLLPFLSFLINIVLGRKYIRDKAHLVAVPSVIGSFLLTLGAFIEVSRSGPIELTLFTWITSGTFQAPLGFLIDQLTVVMLIVVTSVSTLVFIYSIGYMHGDRGYYRFFSYLSLFVFSMIMLVMANNFLLLYFGWEAVGLCSYFLIGFWFDKKSAAQAGKKAFIVNRVGDFGFALGIILVFITFGSLEYTPVFDNVTSASGETMTVFGHTFDMVTVICLLLLCGAVGKSAQFPLHIWLPDAMEGPTPVSALIHAATMVTAGVYLIARANPLFEMSHIALTVVAVIGAFTALFAASIALVQNDIKRIIAYSTLSQLGYMFLALGVGAYSAALFHLVTHAYFKALLFLGAGSVIHALNDEMDITRMGGLMSGMPQTYGTFLIGSLSLSGIPLFAGFFSKDEILVWAYSSGEFGKILWAVGLGAAILTAFYSFRLVFLTFHGQFRGSDEQKSHLHESPWIMTFPLWMLAIGAVVSGWVGISPVFLEHGNRIGQFLSPVVGHLSTPVSHNDEIFVMGLSVLAALIGIVAAFIMYIKMTKLPEKLASSFKILYTVLYNKYWFDEIYSFVIIKPTIWFSRYIVFAFTDKHIIDGIVNGIARKITSISQEVRQIQTGFTSFYGLVILYSVAAIIFALVFIPLLTVN
jgi:NADH-quinone oxidoreductase subunit L